MDTEILRQFPVDCQPVRIEPLGNAGGMSGAQFWRITVPRGMLVLRRWPVEHPTPEQLHFIHAVLDHAAERGIDFLPVPIRTTTGQSFLQHAGHLWELAPWMPGTADYATSPSVERLHASMKALAHFHLAVSDFPRASGSGATGLSPAITSRIDRLSELVHGGQQQQLAEAVTDRNWPEFAPLARQFLSVLPNILPLVIALHAPLADVSFAIQPCIRDIWHDNVLFTSDQVTGIVDFGAMEIDTPACDVARLLGSLVGPDSASRQRGLAAYDSVRSLSPHEMQAVAALDTSIIVFAGCNWIRWIYIEERQFENPAKVQQYFRRIVERAKMFAAAQLNS